MSEAGGSTTPESANAAGFDIIVVAAGASSRMGGRDKLDHDIAGRPLLAHTLSRLAAAQDIGTMIVVTAPERRDTLANAAWMPPAVQAVVAGGERRQDSVRLGFEALEAARPDPAGDRVVLVHDGARPMVSADLIAAVASAAAEHGAAIPVLQIRETVKRVADEQVVETVDRAPLAVAQTPQAVRRGLLRRALAQVVDMPLGSQVWTDEAALLEACRIPVHVVAGDPSNLKVTVPTDLGRASELLTTASARAGIGHDAHPFGPGAPLQLGGVEFEGVPRLHGHSDGDVALHAVADALLGAAGLGDLGRLFPAGPSTPRGIASRDLLDDVIQRLDVAGWRPIAVDLTITASRPRLGPRLGEMAGAIAGILGVPTDAVNVKASTGNLQGADGAGRSISALALATIDAVGSIP